MLNYRTVIIRPKPTQFMVLSYTIYTSVFSRVGRFTGKCTFLGYFAVNNYRYLFIEGIFCKGTVRGSTVMYVQSASKC